MKIQSHCTQCNFISNKEYILCPECDSKILRINSDGSEIKVIKNSPYFKKEIQRIQKQRDNLEKGLKEVEKFIVNLEGKEFCRRALINLNLEDKEDGENEIVGLIN